MGLKPERNCLFNAIYVCTYPACLCCIIRIATESSAGSRLLVGRPVGLEDASASGIRGSIFEVRKSEEKVVVAREDSSN